MDQHRLIDDTFKSVELDITRAKGEKLPYPMDLPKLSNHVGAVIPESWGFLEVESGCFRRSNVSEDLYFYLIYNNLILLHNMNHGNRYAIMQSKLHKVN